MKRSANWLPFNNDNIFFWHHIPEKNIKNTGIIIVGPIGPEYMPTHRSIRLLADNLSRSGFHSIRYDPIGMGNSSGFLDDTNIWIKWTNSPKHLTSYFKDKVGIKNVIYIGIRSGCLVLSDTFKVTQINTAIFWHPISRGSTFIRGIQLLDSVLYKDIDSSKDNTLEGGGYPFTQELQNNIKKINLTNQNYPELSNALVINDLPPRNESKLNNNMVAQNIKTESVYLDGLEDMIKQVTLSKIPYINLEYILNWVVKLDLAIIDRKIEYTMTNTHYKNTNYVETTTTINSGKNIFGILTTPIDIDKNKIVIFTNTGAAHHAGPNRIHVDVARLLAKHGISTLRIDISNIGDSSENYEQDPPNEYPDCATDDINSAINYVDSILKKREIILCGISAGAHNIFHAALKSEIKSLKKIILINPETFYWNPNQSTLSSENTKTDIDQIYYQKQIYDYRKWLSLLTNPQKIYNTAAFATTFIFKKTIRFSYKFLSILNIKVKTQLEKDIAILNERCISINLIYSEDDPGHKIIMSQAGATVIKMQDKKLYFCKEIRNADHTFSSINSRCQLYNTIINFIKNNKQKI